MLTLLLTGWMAVMDESLTAIVLQWTMLMCL
jgi:hypothetical protein